jgi:hypothetical protein
MTPDVNVLVAAARSDHVRHAVARAWLEETLAGPKVFKLPTPIDEAIGFIDALLTLPGVQLAELLSASIATSGGCLGVGSSRCLSAGRRGNADA